MFRALITVALLATALPAVAQPPPGGDDAGRPAMRERMQHFREICQADMDRLCGSAGQERGARRQCLMANQDKLSKPCQDALAQMQQWRRDHPRPDRGGPGPQGGPSPQDGPGPQ